MNIHTLPKARQMTQKRLQEVMTYNPETGVIKWRKQRRGRGCIPGQKAGTLTNGYGIRDDDRWCNLRAATYQENARNRKPGQRNKSGKVGVAVGSKPETWVAHITVDNKTLRLGCYEVKENAIAARCAAEKHYFGVFARRASSG